jgi:3-hydroxyacyl-CoA dehydrogenase/enoyl-CoA hydratase/3-hydroxybutyryl-CoA epimerase
MSIQESIKITAKGEIALVEWDMVGEKVNKLSTPMMMRFREILADLKKSQFKAAVLISRKPKIFIAGADIEEIKSLKKDDEFRKAVQGGQEVMNMIEDLPIPVVAAVHGACMGGGCEMILACDWRICSDAAETKIGLPETKLGIIPGFGGCVRLPRTVGLLASLDIILAGKAVNGKKALKIGLVDQVVDVSLLEEHAMLMAREAIAKGKRRKKFKPQDMMNKFVESFLGQNYAFKKARAGVLKETKGHYPAPLQALEVVQRTYGMRNRNEALEIEREGFVKVGTTDVSKHLIGLFFMMEAVKKRTGVPGSTAKALPVKSVGVLGAGTMGGGIAYVAADRGISVRMKDVSLEAIGRGFHAARSIWDKQVKRKQIQSYDLQRKMNLISGGTDYAGFKTLDVVIEAIVEDMNIKQRVVGETARACRPDCVIATNTSSLSVTEMAKGHPHPEKFGGMHFFNPVNKMPLVEVIRGEKTSDETVMTIFELSKAMGKTPVVVKDGPGFLVNRLLMPYLAESAFMLQDGADIEEVDRVIVYDFGMPMGPYTLIDEVGLDVCAKVLKIFKEAFGGRIEASPLIDKLVKAGRLGKKNGKGFYLYDERGKQTELDPNIYAELGLPRPNKGKLPPQEITERCIFPMINEAALALFEDRIVESAEECDLAMIMGTGFAPFRGGLLHYADALGTEYIANQLEMYATKNGVRFKPTVPLRNMAKTQRKFYS